VDKRFSVVSELELIGELGNALLCQNIGTDRKEPEAKVASYLDSRLLVFGVRTFTTCVVSLYWHFDNRIWNP